MASALQVETIYGLSSTGKGVEVAAGEVIVRFTTGTNRAGAAAAVGASLGDELPGGWQVLKLPPGMGVAAGLNALAAVPGVAKVEYNKVYRPNRIPNDPNVSSQYALSQINAFEGWDYTTGDNTTTIAVLDAGVHATHGEFAGRFLQARECLTSPCANDAVAFACNHGTRVAGVAAAAGDNNSRIAGMNWAARIASVRIFSDAACTDDCNDEVGVCGTTDAIIARAIADAQATIQATASDLGVINLSVGGPATTCNAAVQTAINNAAAARIPVFVSSGNDGGPVNTPANCANVIPVGATDASGSVASFSSRGAELDARGVVAPGVSVLTTDINDGTANATGTSFAAPYAAGLASLLLTVQPTWGVEDIRTALRRSANNFGIAGLTPQSQKAGAGRINAFMALQYAVKGRVADFGGEDKVVAFPNPFRPARNNNVFFAVAPNLQADNAKLKIYTVSGQLVKELNAAAWDGRNKDGQPVATGTYVFVLTNDRGVHRGRFSVIR